MLAKLLIAGFTVLDPAEVRARFLAEVPRRLELPGAAYEFRLPSFIQPQYVLVVDRNPRVQAALLAYCDEAGRFEWIGAVPVSTGQPGAFEYFATPPGVFAHDLRHPDFRAEGTRNQQGIRGYGAKGMRVFDFGWVKAPKGWGDQRESQMRLQVHATDPDRLEPLLGKPGSKGCIRIPAAFNVFLDRYGILDAAYEAAVVKHWVLRPDRVPVARPGRFLVVVDTSY